MGVSQSYGPRNEEESVAHNYDRALELGINFWDDSGCCTDSGDNEELISKVLVPNRDKIFIATKFGFRKDEAASQFRGYPPPA